MIVLEEDVVIPEAPTGSGPVTEFCGPAEDAAISPAEGEELIKCEATGAGIVPGWIGVFELRHGTRPTKQGITELMRAVGGIATVSEIPADTVKASVEEDAWVIGGAGVGHGGDSDAHAGM